MTPPPVGGVLFHWDGNDAQNPDDPGEAAGVAWTSDPANTFGNHLPNASVFADNFTSYNDKITAGATSEVSDKASRRAGYKGWRQYFHDGVNSGSGAPNLDWDTTYGTQTEYWHRWYWRFQPGFKWLGDVVGYWKVWRDWSPPGDKIIGFGYPSGGGFGAHIENHDDPSYSLLLGQAISPAYTWNDLVGGATGDGVWHLMEYHVKINSTTASYDGVLELWVDGVLIGSRSDLNFVSATTGWVGFYVDNQSSIANGPWYLDWADIKVSNSGYIGPV